MVRDEKDRSLPELPLTATTVRVPVINGHSMALNGAVLSPEEAREILGKPGMAVMDDPSALLYPMPLSQRARRSLCRAIRADHPFLAVSPWVVADNIRKGAATNSIQIAELLL